MMNISSASTISTQLTQGVSGVNNQQPVRKVERDREENNNQQANIPKQERFDVDEQALILVEKEYGPQSYNSQNDASQSNDGQQANSQSSTNYDAPSKQNQTAVAAYQSVDNQDKKDTVQQLFGVDLYA